MIRYPYPCTAEARNTVTVCGVRHRVRPLSVAQLAEPLKNKGFTWASLCVRTHRVTHSAHSDAFLHPHHTQHLRQLHIHIRYITVDNR